MIEICDNRDNGYQFKHLNYGDVFDYQGTYAIKIPDIKCGLEMTIYNAVDLQTGKPLSIMLNTYVTECKEVRLEIDE